MSHLDLLSSYDYSLPDRLIAKEPLPRRDESRLMVLERQMGSISHHRIYELPKLLKQNDCLVFNNTRVLSARLLGIRVETGGKWEGLYLSTNHDGLWRLIGQTRGYLQNNEDVVVSSSSGELLRLKLIGREPDGVFLFRPDHDAAAIELLDRFGTLPLPPYVERKSPTANDLERYQTVYACSPGSVAAPTAGLHFTNDLLDRCQASGVGRTEVTLHVGLGTFRPVSVEKLSEHQMHSEWCQLSEAAVSKLADTRSKSGRVVAVGTTSLRTLESAMVQNGGQLRPWSGQTNLFVRPPYSFQLVDGLLTNFHLPKSTLLMLVSAFAGFELVRKAYEVAIDEEYRFFSYGDAMLIL